MRIFDMFDFNNGYNTVLQKYPREFEEIKDVIQEVNAAQHKTKRSNEKTKKGQLLFSPSSLNHDFKVRFNKLGWYSYKIQCDYSNIPLVHGDQGSITISQPPFREMDFVKPNKKLGIEIQFGKYAFMVYNVCAKMTIFKNMDIIDTGIEIVPVKKFTDEMSTGVSYFEQIAWDLHNRGTSNIDVPVLIIGIDE